MKIPNKSKYITERKSISIRCTRGSVRRNNEIKTTENLKEKQNSEIINLAYILSIQGKYNKDLLDA